MRTLSLIAVIFLLAAACSWDSEEDLFPNKFLCDTLDMSFAGDIQPMLSNNCYSCHSNVNAPDFASGIALEDYQDVQASSRLVLGAIRHEDGYPPMPRNAQQLDSCLIAKYEAWYRAGSPDN
jgi:hypothetical protein